MYFATKEELESSNITNTVTYDNVYTKTQSEESFVVINELGVNYYPKSEVYTKIEADGLFGSVDPSNYYTKSEIDNSLNINSDSLIVKKNLVPSVTNTHDIGSASSRFKNVYLDGILNIQGEEIKGDPVNGGISVKNLIIGDDVNGKYKLAVNMVNNKKTLQIIDVGNIEDTINLTSLYELMLQNVSDIQTINTMLTNLQ